MFYEVKILNRVDIVFLIFILPCLTLITLGSTIPLTRFLAFSILNGLSKPAWTNLSGGKV